MDQRLQSADGIAIEKTYAQHYLETASCDSIMRSTEMPRPRREKTGPENKSSVEPIYRNSLLLAVGYLDLTNALDFPANVWNTNPLPIYAIVLMGLGGSIALLATSFAIWDMIRCRRNIEFLRRERAHLQQQTQGLIEKAWRRINTRELCWEIIDRFLLDLFMAITGFFVGVGTLLAIKGPQDPTIFQTSNLLSGYVGNSFLAFFALVSSIWSGIMWTRAHKNHDVVQRSSLEPELARLMKDHAWRHQMYAIVNGTTLVVSGVASMVSATIWQGYVVQIPCVMASLFVVHYWRFCLGYDRLSYQQRRRPGAMNLGGRARAVVAVRRAFADGERDLAGAVGGYGEVGRDAVFDFLGDVGLTRDLEERLTGSLRDEEKPESRRFERAVNDCIEVVGVRQFRYEERFLLELYGYYMREKELARIDSEL